MDIIIRKEDTNDYDKVYYVVKSAFEDVKHSDHNEHNLVNRLRKSKSFIKELSIVAEYNNKIVGYALFTEITVGASTLIALAPIAALPEMQGKGIGIKLIEEGHKVAFKLGYKGCVVLGDDKYYSRFGYKPAIIFNITPPFEVPDENFMAVEFAKDSLKGIEGVVQYANEFFQE